MLTVLDQRPVVLPLLVRRACADDVRPRVSQRVPAAVPVRGTAGVVLRPQSTVLDVVQQPLRETRALIRGV